MGSSLASPQNNFYEKQKRSKIERNKKPHHGRRSGRDRTTGTEESPKERSSGHRKPPTSRLPRLLLCRLSHCEFIQKTGVCFVHCDGGLCADPVRLCAQSRHERLGEGGESSSVEIGKSAFHLLCAATIVTREFCREICRLVSLMILQQFGERRG